MMNRQAQQFSGLNGARTASPLRYKKFTDVRLSKRQQQILDVVKAKIKSDGFPPTIREIGHAVGLSSSSTVHSHLQVLAQKGYLENDKGSSRSLRLVQRVDLREVRDLLDRWLVSGSSCEALVTETQAILATMRGGQ